MVLNIVVSDENLKKGAKELGDFCGFSVNDNGFKIIANKTDEGLRVEFDNAEFRLFYSSKREFYLGISYCVQFFGRKDGVITRKNNSDLGLIKICVGNATPKVQTFKKLIKIMALLGYNSLVLAVEDLFDIESLPYLGSFKQKISLETIKEIDNYAKVFGIELVPGIQSLCPMTATKSRDAFVSVMTYADTLLVSSDKTYEFIEQIIKFCANAFSSKKIHLGMEVAKNIRLGAYFNQNGYVEDVRKIFMQHVSKVTEIAEKYFSRSMIWADNLFYWLLGVDTKNAYQDIDDKKFKGDMLENLSKTIEWQIRAYPNFCDKNFEKAVDCFNEISDNFSVVGDLYTSVGFSPLNKKAQSVADVVIKNSKKLKNKDCHFVLSDENGAECSIFSTISTLIFASEKFYGSKTDELSLNDRASKLFVANFSAFNALDFSSELISNGNDEKIINACKYLFYNDALVGVFDAYLKESFVCTLDDCYKKLKEIDFLKSEFSYLFVASTTLCEFLQKKTALSLNIRKFYFKKDKKELKKIINKAIPDCLKSLDKFYTTFKFQWHKENYSVGFEVIDVRIGGTRERLIQTSKTLDDFLKGKITRIEELEQERLVYSVKNVSGQVFNSYREIVSGSDI